METAQSPAPGTRAAPAALPRSFGRYVLFDLIGRGGMAEIYLARARTTEVGASRLVVVKQILPELSANAKFAEALVQEAKLAARLSHANVAQVFDLGREGHDGEAAETSRAGRLFIAMEYIEGLDLNELLRRCARAKVPLPIEFALLVIMEALKGLDYAHRRTGDDGRSLGIVHRDVSPSNVLLSVEGEIKLCDFGIARANDLAQGAASSSAEPLSPDAIQGKAGYMSPEHARGEPLDARADVFAAGVILWELLAGRRMYKADKDKGENLLAVARRAEIPDVPSRGLPHEDELHAIVRKALAVDRAERYQSAQAMLEALQRYVAKARLVASPIRLGDWLSDHFGNDLVAQRRARERAVKALEAGPVAAVTPRAPGAAPGSPARPVSLWPPAAPPAESAADASAPAADPAPAAAPQPSAKRPPFALIAVVVLVAIVAAALYSLR